MAAKSPGVRSWLPGAGGWAARVKPRFMAGWGMSFSETTPSTTSARARGMEGLRRLPWRRRPSSSKVRMGVRKARSTCSTVPEKVMESRPAATSPTWNPLSMSQPVTRSRARGPGPNSAPTCSGVSHWWKVGEPPFCRPASRRARRRSASGLSLSARIMLSMRASASAGPSWRAAARAGGTLPASSRKLSSASAGAAAAWTATGSGGGTLPAAAGSAARASPSRARGRGRGVGLTGGSQKESVKGSESRRAEKAVGDSGAQYQSSRRSRW